MLQAGLSTRQSNCTMLQSNHCICNLLHPVGNNYFHPRLSVQLRNAFSHHYLQRNGL